MNKAVATLALVNLALAGCASAPSATPSPTPTPAPARSPSGPPIVMTGVAADAVFMPVYVPDEVSVTAGDVTLLLENVPGEQEPQPPAHNFVLSADPPTFLNGDWNVPPTIASSSTIGPNQSEIITVPNLAPGTYTFWCTVRGHFTSGMIGTLTVTP